VARYLAAYRRAVAAIIEESGRPILEWLVSRAEESAVPSRRAPAGVLGQPSLADAEP